MGLGDKGQKNSREKKKKFSGKNKEKEQTPINIAKRFFRTHEASKKERGLQETKTKGREALGR